MTKYRFECATCHTRTMVAKKEDVVYPEPNIRCTRCGLEGYAYFVGTGPIPEVKCYQRAE